MAKRANHKRFDAKVAKLPPKGAYKNGGYGRLQWRRYGCHKWTGAISSGGYGVFWTGRRYAGAHRWNYARKRERAVPRQYVLDHLCRNRWCVQPRHLEPVTVRQNNLRSHNETVLIRNSGRCKAGHEMTTENTIIERETGRPARRRCRACKAQRLAAWNEKRRNAA